MGTENNSVVEKVLEDKLIEALKADGYECVEIHGEKDLEANFKRQIEKHNEARLRTAGHGPVLSGKEFQKILAHIMGKDIFTSATLLRDDPFPIEGDDGKTFYIELMNTREWCNNEFQVAHQIRVDSVSAGNDNITRRYDVTILINGLPVTQIELKKPGVDLKIAFNQVRSYTLNSYNRFFRFIQVFVISNGELTKYFANNRYDDLNYGFTFAWAGIDNKHVDNLNDFALYFLNRCQIAKIIARYMVLDQANHSLIVMRPYQVHAVEALMSLAKETCNNAYVWHTTGSGKTLTSFKLAQLLSVTPEVGHAIFLVDRKDLDGQTIKSFNRFQKDSVNRTNSTNELKKRIDDGDKIIVTTIQKMSNLCKADDGKLYVDKLTADGKKVVFIIDECHRSNFGDMHKAISKAFGQGKAQYFGFTGTPIFQENKTATDQTTADIFGNCAHTYMIKDAIADGSVLGFSVDYVKTINTTAELSDDREVERINTDKALRDPQRIRNVTKYILSIHDKKTLDRTYNAIFATKSIPMLIQYYKEFKKQQEEMVQKDPNYKPLKIAAIFTCGNEEDGDDENEFQDNKELSLMIDDFNGMFHSSHSISNRASYLEDITKKVANKEVDILLVVNMFLTGFDSKLTNTLYVDKSLKYQSLLQAFSRTNRVQSAKKQFGNIVCFQTNRKAVDEAIALYSHNEGSAVLRAPYSDYLNQFKTALDALFEKFPTPESTEADGDEVKQKLFVQLFKQVTRLLTTLKTFDEFEFTKECIGIDSSTYDKYLSRYLDIYRRRNKTPAESINNDVDFEIELVENQTIDVHYILKLVQEAYGDKGMDRARKQKRIEEILELMKQSGKDSKLFLKSDLIKTFVFEILPSKEHLLDPDFDIDAEFQSYMTEESKKQVQEKSQELGVTYEDLCKWIADYTFSETLDNRKIADAIPPKAVAEYQKRKNVTGFIFQVRNEMVKEIIEWIEEYVQTYNDVI